MPIQIPDEPLETLKGSPDFDKRFPPEKRYPITIRGVSVPLAIEEIPDLYAEIKKTHDDLGYDYIMWKVSRRLGSL